jgi:DUF4097 and DUF4098 domain-containing protein YvlB
MSPQTHTASQEFPVSSPVTADIRLGGGSIAVTAEDRPFAVVTIDPYDSSEASRQAAEQTEVALDGTELRIEVPQGNGRMFRRGGQVRVDLRVPLDSRIRAHAGSADVRTEGRLGEVVVQTGSGDAYVTQVTGTFRADTGSGDVRADEVGAIHADTASGDVSAMLVSGDAHIKTASGDVELEEGLGSIVASTASGNVVIRAARGEKVNVRTASGDAMVGVPAGTRVWLDLSTASGKTTSDLAMTDIPTEGAQLTVQVRTASGDITLRRATPTENAATRTAT